MSKFNQDFKVTLVIVYERYHAAGINNWFYTRHEERAKLDSFWTMKDEVKCFREHFLLRFDKIVAIRHEYEYVNRSRNHHNRSVGISDDVIFDF